MNQLGLFDPRKLARTENPETSKAAARECRTLRGVHCRMILDILRTAGVALNADQIADRSGGAFDRTGGAFDRHQVGRRLSELLTAGLVELSGDVAPSHAGRMARTYRLAMNGASGGV